MKVTTKKFNSSSNGSVSTWNRGQKAEAQAAQFLLDNGLRVIDKNFRWRGGEIDLIALDRPKSIARCEVPTVDELVFIEVRSSVEAQAHLLRYSLGFHKRLRLIKTAQVFIHRNPQFTRLARRFDVIWVEANRLEHWKNVII